MTTTSPRESARIYAFVPRARLAATGQPPEPMLGKDGSSSHLPVCEFGSGWYHEAAIRETDRPRKS